ALQCSFGSMPSGATQTIHLSATTWSDPCDYTFPDTATVAADNDSNAGNNSSAASTLVKCSTADVKVVKTADSSQIYAGDTVAFTIVVTSLGPATATNVTLLDALFGYTGPWTQDNSNCLFASAALQC